jgi:hypothetical protein
MGGAPRYPSHGGFAIQRNLKKPPLFFRGGKTRFYAYDFISLLTRFLAQISLRKLDCYANRYPLRSKTLCLMLAVAVMLGVMTAGFDMVMLGMAGVAMRAVRMMSRLFVIAGFMMLGSFAMVLRGMLVMFGRLVMMLDACVVGHVSSPGLAI